MATPTKNSIVNGLLFVFTGVLKVLCDRWLTKLKVQGFPTRVPHIFSHTFLLWFIKQVLQMVLLLLWTAIYRNWFGLGRCKHGEVKRIDHRRPQDGRAPTDSRCNLLDGDHNAIEYGTRGDAIHEDFGANAALVDQDDRGIGMFDNGDPVIRNRKRQKYTVLLYLFPALLETLSVLLMYFGPKLTYSSSYIMLKGTVALFTTLLSVAFLAQQLMCHMWFGVIVTMLGFGMLGISDYVHKTPEGYEKYGIAAGDLLIVMAQIVFASKLIYEEKFIRKHAIHPLVFLGAEGVYGIIFSFILLVVFNLESASQYSELPNGNVEDFVDAFYQMSNSVEVVFATLGSVLLFVLYTYLGLFLVRDEGALPRIIVEMLIYAFYWAIALGLDWDNFYIVQIPGFLVVAFGILFYSHILVLPFGLCQNREVTNEDLVLGADNCEDLNYAGEGDGGAEEHVDGDGNVVDAAERPQHSSYISATNGATVPFISSNNEESIECSQI